MKSREYLSAVEVEDHRTKANEVILTEMLALFRNKNEGAVLNYIDEMLNSQVAFKKSLLEIKNRVSDCSTDSDHVGALFNMRMLDIAAQINMPLIVKKLLDLGADINEKSDGPGYTALVHACMGREASMVEFLLAHGADITVTDNENIDVSKYATHYEVLKILVNHEAKHNIKCLFTSVKANTNLVNVFLIENNAEAVEKLFSNRNLIENVDNELALFFLRRASWDFKDNRVIYERLCDEINAKIVKQPALDVDIEVGMVADYKSKSVPQYVSLMQEYFNIDRDSLKALYRVKRNKAQATQMAIAQIESLTTLQCLSVSFFQHMNNELRRYMLETYQKEPSQLDESETKIVVLDGTEYRVPVSMQYKGIEKSHALQELLIVMLRSHGLANNTYKWVGSIPSKIASPMLQAGDFCTENRIGMGLLHGKLSHMFHILYCIYLLNSGMLNSDYCDEQGTELHLSIRDILDALFTLRHPIHNFTLFKSIFDTRQHDVLSFGDPHRLASILMCYGSKLGVNDISNYMTDSFCQGYIALIMAHNQNRDGDAYTSIDEFTKHFSDIDSSIFRHSDTVAKFAMDVTRRKYPNNLMFDNPEFIVVKKDYHVNANFIPKFIGTNR